MVAYDMKHRDILKMDMWLKFRGRLAYEYGMLKVTMEDAIKLAPTNARSAGVSSRNLRAKCQK